MPQGKRPCKVTALICDALCSLIEENKPYETLSLQEIVDRAGVCRNSFYRNYHSKEDIFKAQFQEICQQSDQLFVSQSNLSLYGIVYSIAAVMERNRRFLLCFYQASAKLYFDTLIRQIEKSNTSKPISSLSPDEYYLFASRAWVTIGVLTEWLQKGCDIPAEKIASLLQSWAA
jgi:AcrR family transcriptional regulator